MNDGRTRRVEAVDSSRGSNFLENHRTTIVLISGHEAGTEWPLEGVRSVIGRSEKAGIRLDDRSVSSEHAVFELGAEGFGIRDLASTNGLRVNGRVETSCVLEHGDRIKLGDFELQIVIEDRVAAPRSWSVDDEA